VKQAKGSMGAEAKTQRYPPLRAMLANRRFQRTLTPFAPLTRER